MTSKRSPSESRRAVALFVAVKLLILWFGVQAYIVMRNESLPTPHYWLSIWNQWDTRHYLDIARDGYVTEGDARRWIVFFPLYPWLVRAVDFVVNDVITSAFVVTTIASLFVAWLMFKLARLDEDDEGARDVVWFLAIWPAAYFLHIAYTESLFLALLLGSFYAARRGKWAAAGVVGAFAALTRVNGALLVPALALEVWSEWRKTRRFDPRWLWLLFIGMGTLTYLIVNKVVTGDFLMFRHYQAEHWNHTMSFPLAALADSWRGIWVRPPAESIMVGWQELLFALIAIGATIWSWFRLRPSYALWATLNVLLVTSVGLLLGAPRYCLTIFPIFFCFARLTRERPTLRAAITTWSLLWLALFAGQFVQGKWAF